MSYKKDWNESINNLLIPEKANDAAHILASNLEVLPDILVNVGKDFFIANCLTCYSVDWSAQPYLDEILSHFTLHELVSAYKQLKVKPIQTAGALMWLIENIDPEYKWALYS